MSIEIDPTFCIIFFVLRLTNVEAHEIKLNFVNKSESKQTQDENEIGLVVDQSIDWLYQKLFVLVLVENVKGQKEYRIASCNLGKSIIYYIIKFNQLDSN